MEDLLKSSFGKPSDYPLHTYAFILDALKFAQKTKGFQISTAEQIHELIGLFAAHEFGPMAHFTLNKIGIKSCRDIGKILCQLRDYKFIKLTSDLPMEKFSATLHFDKFFPSLERPEKEPCPQVKKINNFRRFS